MAQKPVLGIILGDAAGVGYEIIAKLCAEGFFSKYCRPILIGDLRVLNRAFDVIGKTAKIQTIETVDQADWTQGIPLLDRKNVDPAEVPFGEGKKVSGAAVLDAINLCVELYREGKIQGFCFGPFNKAMLKEAGCHFESEHHYIADLLHHTAPFGEINAVGSVWTTRTTSHIPIKDVSDHLTLNSIGRAITLMDTTLRNAGIENPRIAVAALNPHAGENGTCGREEIDVITPAIEEAKGRGVNASGPYPSDTLFIKAFRGDVDGVVTMFHDQGQIALKLKGFDEGITIGGGFEIPVVTCGHGTAYDIAGKGIVKTSSFENAVKMAAQMAEAKAATA